MVVHSLQEYQFKMFMLHEVLDQFVPGIGTHAETDTKMYSTGKIIIHFSMCHLPTSEF